MTVEAFGVLAEDMTQFPLEVEAGDNPQFVTIVWDDDRIEVETEEEVTGALVLIYSAEGWNTNVRAPESGGGVRLVRYCSTGGPKSHYALVLVVSEGDIVLTDSKRKKHEFDFLQDGTLLNDEADGEDAEYEDD